MSLHQPQSKEALGKFKDCKWSENNHYDCEEGRKTFNRCKTVLGANCPRVLMILESNASKKTILFSSENVSHEQSGVASNSRLTDLSLSIQMKKDIDEIVELGITKPDQILSKLRKQNKKEPHKSKLVSYLTRQRKKKPLYKISLTSLRKFCIENSETLRTKTNDL